jgi:hypothetical protein
MKFAVILISLVIATLTCPISQAKEKHGVSIPPQGFNNLESEQKRKINMKAKWNRAPQQIDNRNRGISKTK